MKNQETIKKLALLRSIQPTKRVLLNIRGNVFQMKQPKNRIQNHFHFNGQFSNIAYLIPSYRIGFFASVIAVFFIVVLSSSMILLPNQTHTAIIYGKLAFASNQYEKARIVLDDTKSRFANNKTTLVHTNELVDALTLTNTELNRLQLKGEKGKYTAQQCHQIYQEYLHYLERKKKIIPPNNSILKSKINSYEEQAEKKLYMYNSL